MTDRSRLITWDVTLLIGIVLYIFLHTPAHQNLVVGLVTVLVFSNCVREHISVYKLTGKIY